METFYINFNINRHHRVEREPMWDGNNNESERRMPVRLVEREPMWDGNNNRVKMLVVEF